MIISISPVTSGTTSNDTTATTASIDRQAGDIFLIAVGTTRNNSNTPEEPTVTGTGITQLASVTLLVTATGSNRRRVTLIIVRADSTGTNTMTINHATAPSSTRIGWVVSKATGVDTTTPSITSNDSTQTGVPTANALEEFSSQMNALQKEDNRLFMVEFGNTNVLARAELDSDKAGSTDSKDWTTLGNANMTSAPVFRMISAWLDNATPDLRPGFVVNDTPIYGMIAIELNALVAKLPYWGIAAK